MKRVGLANPPVAPGTEAGSTAKFDLDREVRDDSFSAGEKQLLALCRALVKSEAKVLVLDEATSSVGTFFYAALHVASGVEHRSADVATDATIQMMIQQDFKNKTLLCIAHRCSFIVLL